MQERGAVGHLSITNTAPLRRAADEPSSYSLTRHPVCRSRYHFNLEVAMCTRIVLILLILLVLLPMPSVVAEAAPPPGPVPVGEGGMDFAAISQLLALLGMIAFLVEAVVEVLFLSWLKWAVDNFLPDWDDEKRAEVRALILRIASYALGIVLSITIGFDLVAAVVTLFGATVEMPEVAATIGRVLTGILVARGAQWFHDLGTELIGLDVVKRRPANGEP